MTGHRGMIGRWVVDQLERDGRSVVGFDLGDGADLLDLAAVKAAAAGCSAIVHLGALAHDTAGTPEDIMAINVVGTWHVLLAAESAGVGRVVHFSSGQVLGIAEGERLPEYFPVDDEHPRRATRPYGLSKRLAEDLCHGFTARTGIASLSLRPVAVWEPDTPIHGSPSNGPTIPHRNGCLSGNTAPSWTSATSLRRSRKAWRFP